MIKAILTGMVPAIKKVTMGSQLKQKVWLCLGDSIFDGGYLTSDLVGDYAYLSEEQPLAKVYNLRTHAIETLSPSNARPNEYVNLFVSHRLSMAYDYAKPIYLGGYASGGATLEADFYKASTSTPGARIAYVIETIDAIKAEIINSGKIPEFECYVSLGTNDWNNAGYKANFLENAVAFIAYIRSYINQNCEFHWLAPRAEDDQFIQNLKTIQITDSKLFLYDNYQTINPISADTIHPTLAGIVSEGKKLAAKKYYLPYTGSNPEINLYTNELFNAPISDIQKSKLNTFASTIKSEFGITNLSDAFDQLYILAVENDVQCLRNIINTYKPKLTRTGGLPFTALEGISGDGTNWLVNYWKPAINGVKFTQNNCSIGIYSRTNVDESTVDVGVQLYNSKGTMLSFGTGYKSMNGLRTSIVTPITPSTGLLIGVREDSNTEKYYHNGILVDTISKASEPLNDNNVFLFALDDYGTHPSWMPKSTKQLSLFFTGRALSQSEITSLTNAFESYMDSNSKGVI